MRALAVVTVLSAVSGAALPAGAAQPISTADYATLLCQSGGAFRTAIAVASSGLNTTSTDLPTVRSALVTFADNARAATRALRRVRQKLRSAKSSALRTVNAKTIAKLRALERVLATAKSDANRLNVTDANAFGIGLVLVQTDLKKFLDGYAAIGAMKYPKVLERAVANDAVCQQVEGTTQTTTAPAP
jgi:hypothetical protein